MTAFPILLYHAISNDIGAHEADFTTRPNEFIDQMAALADWGYRTVTMHEAVGLLAKHSALPPRTIAITFDDVFTCMVRVALPVMARHGFVSTAYPITGFLGRDNGFDKLPERSPRTVAARADILDLHAAGMEIGSHTITHPKLTTLEPQRLASELRDSKATLEDLIGGPVESLAYPYGLHDARVIKAAREAGYLNAASTIYWVNTPTTDPYRLRRITMGAGVTPEEFRKRLNLGKSLKDKAKASVKLMLGRL